MITDPRQETVPAHDIDPFIKEKRQIELHLRIYAPPNLYKLLFATDDTLEVIKTKKDKFLPSNNKPGDWLPEQENKKYPLFDSTHIFLNPPNNLFLAEPKPNTFGVPPGQVGIYGYQLYDCVRLTKTIPTWNEKTIRLFSIKTIENISFIKLYFLENEKDRKALEIAKLYAQKQTTIEILSQTYEDLVSETVNQRCSMAPCTPWHDARAAEALRSNIFIKQAIIDTLSPNLWNIKDKNRDYTNVFSKPTYYQYFPKEFRSHLIQQHLNLFTWNEMLLNHFILFFNFLNLETTENQQQ